MSSSSDTAPLESAWNDTWQLLGAQAPGGELEALLAAWGEPQRHYHDHRHLRECLAHWAAWRGLAEHPGEVGLAVWYHDAVYDPQAKGNEQRSAEWAERVVHQAALGDDMAGRLRALIMATCHDAPLHGADARLLSDIDLAILGAAPPRFEGYDADVRREYAWVPEPLYRQKRCEVLQQFLHRERIYRTRPAFEALEAQARINLAAAVARLSNPRESE